MIWPFRSRSQELARVRAAVRAEFWRWIEEERRRRSAPTQLFQSSGYRWCEVLQGVNGGSLWRGERRWLHESGAGEVYDSRALPVTTGYVLGETCMRETMIGWPA